MAQKLKSSEEIKERKILIDYNRARFVCPVAKLCFDKVIEINKNYIVQWGMDFEGKEHPFKGCACPIYPV